VTNPTASVDVILGLYSRLGTALFFGAPVSQTEHALQTAWLAEQAGAAGSLIAAALVHDIGRLLMDHAADSPDATASADPGHAETGALWLSALFPESVAGPVRLHVAAKRFLCTTEPDYQSLFGSGRRRSLGRQGGLMTPAEAAAFKDLPFAREATALRRWDDTARVAGLPTPSLAHFRPHLESLAKNSP
jgi:predicted HD phosphohydrolase